MQAARRSVHQLRKRRHIILKGQWKTKVVGIWRVAGSPLLQTKALGAFCIFKRVLLQLVCEHNAQNEHAVEGHSCGSFVNQDRAL